MTSSRSNSSPSPRPRRSSGPALVICTALGLLGGCAATSGLDSRALANPQGRDGPERVLDAVDTNQAVLDAGWQRQTGEIRVRAAGSIGGSFFEASGSEVDPRAGDYGGATASFRTELLYAPCSNFEIGPRLLIGGRGYEFEDDERLEYGAFDLFGELVARTYVGPVRPRQVRPYFEAFAGGGLQSGEIEFTDHTPFGRIQRSRRETGGVFTFGGGAGIEWFSDNDVTGTLGVEVRSVQNFDTAFFENDLDQFDVSLVFGLGYSL